MEQPQEQQQEIEQVKPEKNLKEYKAQYFKKRYYENPDFRAKMIEDKKKYYYDNKEKILEDRKAKYNYKRKPKTQLQT